MMMRIMQEKKVKGWEEFDDDDDNDDDDNDDDEDYAGEEGHKVGRDLSGAANTLCLTVILSVKAVKCEKCEKCECSETCPTFSVKALRDKVSKVFVVFVEYSNKKIRYCLGDFYNAICHLHCD